MRALGFGALFLVATAAGFATGLSGMVDRIGVKLEGRLERLFGVTIDVEEAAWSLGGEVTLRGVVVRNRAQPQAPPLFKASHVRLQGEVSLFSARARMVSVEVQEGAVHIARKRDGSSNIDGVLRGLKKLFGRGGGGGGGGGGFRFLSRHIPKVTFTGLHVSADLGRKLGPIKMPIVLRGGDLKIENTAVVREEDNITLSGGFKSTSVGSGHRLNLDAKFVLKQGLERFGLSFSKPSSVAFGERLLSVRGVSWEKGGVLSVKDVALSDRLTSEERRTGARRAPAVTIQAVRVMPTPGVDFSRLRTLALRGLSRSRLEALLSSVATVEIVKPVFAFERWRRGHNFSDLTSALNLTSSPRDPGFGLVFGETMKATRAAAIRLSGSRKKSGEKLRRAMIGAFTSFHGKLKRLSPRVIKLSRLNPFKHLRIREGHFTWRTASRKKPRVHRFESFNVDIRRKGEVINLGANFLMPKVGLGRNVLSARIHRGTGDLQVQVKAQRLRLYPYRHVFPPNVPVERATALTDTDLTLVWSPTRGVAQASGKLGVRDLALWSKAVAREPLKGINLQVNFNVGLDFSRSRVDFDLSQMRIGKVSTALLGHATHMLSAPRLSWVFRLRRSRCQDIADSLPTAFINRLEGIRLQGTLGWQLEVTLDTADIDSLKYVSNPALTGFKVLNMSDRIDFEAVRGTFRYRFVDTDGTVRDFPLGPGAPGWASLDAISPYVVKAITTTEDGSFFRHKGFSIFAIRSSILTNLKRGGFYRGASTVSQQLVKNIFLSREKTISRKVQEMFITWQLEKALTKRRIMELYLNAIELGPGIYGIRRAARHYFGKRPSQLSLLESVFIVSLIPSPKRYYRQFLRGEVTDGWRRHLKWIIGVMLHRGKISEAAHAAAAPYSPLFRGRKRKPDPNPDEKLPPPPQVPPPPPQDAPPPPQDAPPPPW